MSILKDSYTTNNIKKKILGVKDLSFILKKKKFSLCHGAFDIVHPGHLRQFIYAKKFSDILVVSITDDNFIAKSNVRPFVNQELRAINLASYEIVDYVIIDSNPEPYNLIKKIKPSFFIRGFEYKSLKNPKTIREYKLLKKIGGKLIFSPGDVVFSSSSFIKNAKPDLKFEKIFTLLNSEKLKIADLKNIVCNFKKKKIFIVGDTIVDRYSYASVIGGMHKSPIISIKIDNKEDFIGGAAIVALHLKAAGANVFFSSTVGYDLEGDYVRKKLLENKIRINILKIPNKPTNLKNTIVSSNQKLLKIDRVENNVIDNYSFLKLFKKSFLNCDGVIFSDFRHGIFNKETITLGRKIIKNIKFKVGDTQVASRWGNLADFKNFDLLTPNEKETRFALGDQDTVLRPLGKRLMNLVECKYLFIKLGPNGAISIRDDKSKKKRPSFHIDSLVEEKENIDPVGAGDAFLAYSTLSMLVKKNDVAALVLGSVAAKISCGNRGNLPVLPSQIISYLNYLESLEKEKIF